MSKFNMKDYEDFMKEEERQNRLQRDLEYKRYEESYESEENWRDYQRKQEEERQWEAFNSYPEYDGYFDEDDFRDNDSDDGDYGLKEAYDPFGDLLDANVSDLDDDSCEGCYMYPRCDMCSCYPCHYFFEMQILAEGINNLKDIEAERGERKSVAINRQLNKAKARKSKAQNATYVAQREFRKCSRRICKLDREYFKLSNKLYSDNYFTYSKSQSITKQLNIILDQLHYLHDEAVYFKGILEMSEYKQALSAPKAV